MIFDWIAWAREYAVVVSAGIGFLLLVLSMIGLVLPAVRGRSDRIRKDLEVSRGRTYWLVRLGGSSGHWRERYNARAQRITSFLDGWLGLPFSSNGFFQCFLFAFV